MELFAITDNTVGTRIVKIVTDRPTQNVITQLFNEQKTFFEDRYTEGVEFSGGYITSGDEFFVIPDFDDVIAVLDAINNPTAIPEWEPEDISAFNIIALFSGYPEENEKPAIALIQSFDKRQVIDNRRTIFHKPFQAGNTFCQSAEHGIVIDNKLTAILTGTELKFKSFHMLRRIFDVDAYFREATNEELTTFSSHEKFSVAQGFDLTTIADSVIRKKVSLINKSRILEDYSVTELRISAAEIGVVLDTENAGEFEKIKMPQIRKDVKRLLHFLDEDYFTSHITRTLYRANSKHREDV
ncbi:Kiwa anti-phage protein KwaB-like domain-containing protein [Klebsiella grimontii]|uniref:Kiwa anti-phage protein KwaB-like domain-containing protein n=1 Tax=Klebsiella grimontii TaxID=2058152 RepID=UPI00292EDE2D|nr:Kiwa anti-phage protein KwaB-like domain-containing protein [Klebsiella grimontii]